MSKIDTDNFSKIAQALQFQYTKTDAIVDQKKPDPTKPKQQNPDNQTKDEQKANDVPLDLNRLREQERMLKESLTALQDFIVKNKLENNISLRDTPRGIAITLKDLFLFDTGRADLKQNAYPLLDQLAKVFVNVKSKISIEGHTDNRPLFTGSLYGDNWGLSAARSLSVLRYFVYEKQLPSKNLISTGFSDTMPVAPNNNDANRAKNRRVEIVILR
jgi:chemotaxis protein MotB